MELKRVHAYSVAPQRLEDSRTTPLGGSFQHDGLFEAILADYIDMAGLLKTTDADGIHSRPTISGLTKLLQRRQCLPVGKHPREMFHFFSCHFVTHFTISDQ